MAGCVACGRSYPFCIIQIFLTAEDDCVILEKNVAAFRSCVDQQAQAIIDFEPDAVVASSFGVSYAFSFLALTVLLLLPDQKEEAQLRKRTWEVSVRAPAPGHELLPPAACAAVMRGSRVASPCTSPLSQCTSPQMHARPLSALLPLVGKKVEGS